MGGYLHISNTVEHIRKIIDSESTIQTSKSWSPFQDPAYRKEAKEHRRALRKNATPQEVILWSRLRSKQLGQKFRRQHSIGPYIADFYCVYSQLIVEVDGSQHFEEDAIRYDVQRTRFLESQGCTVLRFVNDEINTNIEGVLMCIMDKIEEKQTTLTPALSQRERGQE